MRDTGNYWGIPGIWAIFAGAGAVSIVSAIFASDPRQVLFVIGITSMFAGILTHLVTPRRFVRAPIVERLHSVMVANVALHVPFSELQGERTYVPRDGREPGDGSAFLLVSCEDEHGPGTSVYPTGDALLAEFIDHTVMDLSDSPTELGRQIADGLENGLELVETASCFVDPSEGRATVQIKGNVIDTVEKFDDPIASFVGTTFAFGLGQRVTVETEGSEHGAVRISCLWEETARMDEQNGARKGSAISLSSDS